MNDASVIPYSVKQRYETSAPFTQGLATEPLNSYEAGIPTSILSSVCFVKPYRPNRSAPGTSKERPAPRVLMNLVTSQPAGPNMTVLAPNLAPVPTHTAKVPWHLHG
jgi:hypothetical protein